MKVLVVFVAVFLIAFMVVRWLFPGGILFYQGMGLAVTAAALFAVLFRDAPGVGRDAVLLFLLLYVFVFTIPTTVDRAYSVRMLLRIDASPRGLSRDEIGQMYVDGFLAEGGVDKRISEQVATGSIADHDGRLEITRLGAALALSFRAAQRLFAADQNR
jgi:hypothetical protein